MTDDCVFIESQKAHAEQQVIDLKEENAKLVSELRGSKGLVASLSAALMIEGDSARETLLKDLRKSTERCASLEAMIHRDQEVISSLKGSLRRSEDAQKTIASSMIARLESAEGLVKEAKEEARRAEASRADLEAAVKEERTYAFLSNQVEASRREARELVAACEDAEAALSNNVEFEGCIRRRLENQIRVLQREIQVMSPPLRYIGP
jgi:chromosome segregation ATPase